MAVYSIRRGPDLAGFLMITLGTLVCGLCLGVVLGPLGAYREWRGLQRFQQTRTWVRTLCTKLGPGQHFPKQRRSIYAVRLAVDGREVRTRAEVLSRPGTFLPTGEGRPEVGNIAEYDSVPLPCFRDPRRPSEVVLDRPVTYARWPLGFYVLWTALGAVGGFLVVRWFRRLMREDDEPPRSSGPAAS